MRDGEKGKQLKKSQAAKGELEQLGHIEGREGLSGNPRTSQEEGSRRSKLAGRRA